MRQNSYGTTGQKISAIGFGGMRFSTPRDLQRSAELVLYAHDKGINYFDTAPGYCNDLSEEIMGAALSQLPRDSYAVASKCSRHSADELRQSLEQSLRRLRVESIDFFHIWCLMNPADWQKRLQGGAVEAALRAREEGLIRHLVCSSHMPGKEISVVLEENIFAGVLLGYNVLNFPYRSAAVELAGAKGLGVAAMNPLGGGLIPQNAERFAFLAEDTEDAEGGVVEAALRFNASHPHITTTLVGFSSRREIDQACAALERFTPDSPQRLARLKQQIEASFNGLCTGCGYCLPCPAALPIPRFLDACNRLLLQRGKRRAALDRLTLHWHLSAEQAADCTGCGLCEERCTQQLPIRQRLAELLQLGREPSAP